MATMTFVIPATESVGWGGRKYLADEGTSREKGTFRLTLYCAILLVLQGSPATSCVDY